MSEDLVQTILQLAYKVHILVHLIKYTLVHIFCSRTLEVLITMKIF
jgi:hypothetical protein